MKRIFAAIQAVLASIRTVLRPVFRAGNWTMEKVSEVARPVIGLADQALHVAEGAVEWAATLPVRVIGGLFAGTQRGGGESAKAAAQQASQQVRARASEADQAALLQQKAGLVQRAAGFKARGHDWEGAFGEVLPRAHATWIRQLSAKEAEILAQADTREVMAVLAGRSPRIKGVRSPADLDALAAQQRPEKAAPQISAAQQAVLDAVAARIKAAQKSNQACEPAYASLANS